MDKRGNPDDEVRGHLPADLINPVVAYSLNRKIRYLYDGELFRYRQSSGAEGDYPSSVPNLSEAVYLVKIYDQKARDGVASIDAVQSDTSKQPILSHDGNFYVANFMGGQYLELNSAATEVSADLSVLFVGSGDYPRPAFGLWGTDNASVEPAYNARFTLNDEHGGVTDFTGKGVITCFSGFHPASNGRVMYILSDGTYGDMTSSASTASFSSVAIGRNDDRYFEGEVLEVVLHQGDLSKEWGDELHDATRTFYTNYN